MARTVAITGVNSYFASTLLPRLQADADIDRIVGIDVTPWKGGFKKVDFQRLDIRSEKLADALSGVHALYHLAFVVAERHDKNEIHDINIAGTRNVFEAAIKAGVQKVIYTSSTTAYGAHPDNPLGFDESQPLRPNLDSYYSSDKVAVEQFAVEFCRSHPEVIFTVLRAALGAGPHMKNFFHQLYSMPLLALAQGRSPQQHFIHEEDLGDALYLAFKKDVPGIYNVGADDTVPAEWAFNEAGVRVVRLPAAVLKTVMNAAFAVHLLPASQGWVSLSEYTIFPNSEKFKRATGWSPRYSSAETFKDYLRARKREPDNFKQAVLSWIFSSGRRTRPTMAVLQLFKLGKIPWVRNHQPWMAPEKNSFTYLPINERLETVQHVLPPTLVHEFIDQAEHHVVMDKCGCKLARRCRHFTAEIGCLFMGETALKMPHGVSRRVTREQAHAHVERAVEVGLVPMTGKVRVDNFIFLTPDESKLLSVCFCCHCCCMMTSFKHIPGYHLDHVMPRLEGLAVTVTENCLGCGHCVETCGFAAITIEGGHAVHNAQCRGCGRCERTCPNDAVRIRVTNPTATQDAKRRIESYVHI
jgi:UDP-glucose 4-epimerase